MDWLALNPTTGHMGLVAGIGLALMGLSFPGKRLARALQPIAFIVGLGLIVAAVFKHAIVAEVVLALLLVTAFLIERRWSGQDTQQSTEEPAVNLSFVGSRTDPRVLMIQRTHAEPVAGYSGGTINALSTSATGTNIHMGGGYSDETRYASFVFARVVNDHFSPGVGVTAKDVRCYVSFFSRDKVWSFPQIKGRWRDADSPLSLSTFQLHTADEAIDIPADGEPRELDVAMKYPEDAYCFAYNNDNAAGHQWSRKPEHLLTELEFIAEVTVRGSNFIAITKRFVVSHGGVGTVLNIRDLNEGGNVRDYEKHYELEDLYNEANNLFQTRHEADWEAKSVATRERIIEWFDQRAPDLKTALLSEKGWAGQNWFDNETDEETALHKLLIRMSQVRGDL